MSKLDPKIIEKIIDRAERYTRMAGALTTDAAFGRAAKEFLGDGHARWGAYKKAAKAIFLSRQEELREAKREELRRGAQEAAWARRDEEMLTAEETEEKLSEERAHRRNIARK